MLALRPPIEIRDQFLVIGKRKIRWGDIQRVDRTGWISPLIVRLTLADKSRVLLIYPGDLETSRSLLRHLRRHARQALIDGVPHRNYWGEGAPGTAGRKSLPAPRYPLLRDEDEAEVERLYQRLKTVGHLDPKNSDEN
jgi:hypothetical protein